MCFLHKTISICSPEKEGFKKRLKLQQGNEADETDENEAEEVGDLTVPMC